MRHSRLQKMQVLKSKVPPALNAPVWSEHRKRSKQGDSTDPAIARKALEKLLEKIRATQCCSDVSERHTGPTIRLVRSISIAALVKFSPIRPSMHSDSPRHWFRRAAFLKQHRYCDTSSGPILIVTPRGEPRHQALYEAKRYQEAIPQYQWILAAKPEAAVAHYFIATSHDYLGEYPEALASYENFWLG